MLNSKNKEINNHDLALFIYSKIKDKHPKRQIKILEKSISIIIGEFCKIEFGRN